MCIYISVHLNLDQQHFKFSKAHDLAKSGKPEKQICHMSVHMRKILEGKTDFILGKKVKGHSMRRGSNILKIFKLSWSVWAAVTNTID